MALGFGKLVALRLLWALLPKDHPDPRQGSEGRFWEPACLLEGDPTHVKVGEPVGSRGERSLKAPSPGRGTLPGLRPYYLPPAFFFQVLRLPRFSCSPGCGLNPKKWLQTLFPREPHQLSGSHDAPACPTRGGGAPAFPGTHPSPGPGPASPTCPGDSGGSWPRVPRGHWGI